MTTFTLQGTRRDRERARLLHAIAEMQTELAQAQAELARCWARVHAGNTHLFTLTFPHGEVALLDVYGAANHEQAHAIAQDAIKTCRYTVTDGDTTHGQAQYLYHWCSSEAQERSVRRHEEVQRTR